MSHRTLCKLGFAALLAILAAGAWADDTEPQKSKTPPVSADAKGDTAEGGTKTARPAPPMPIYRPPSVGKPARTLGGG